MASNSTEKYYLKRQALMIAIRLEQSLNEGGSMMSEDRIFNTEIKRIDSSIENIKKLSDWQDDKFTRVLEKLEKTLDARFEKIDQRFEKLENALEARFEKIDQRFEKLENALEAKFEKIDQQFEKVDQRFEKTDQRFEKIDEKMDSNFKWLVGIYVPLTGMLLAAFYAFATYIRP